MGEVVPRVGLGVDLHPWATDGRRLWLGGVSFEGEPGLAGHSDGDVVCHAIADALLGAAALGDVGQHFPESDPLITGIAGRALLAGVVELVRGAGFSVRSCDSTVICERPPIAPRRDELRSCLAETLAIPVAAMSVKATRPEGLGLVGDGVGCMAVAVIA
ncbi:MAG: 2-C-methyl-D-erythritol 2,4-cyclodiphosphate synthase [Actinomycetota bacterium]